MLTLTKSLRTPELWNKAHLWAERKFYVKHDPEPPRLHMWIPVKFQKPFFFNIVCETEVVALLLEGINGTDGGHISSACMQTLQPQRLTFTLSCFSALLIHTYFLSFHFSGALSPSWIFCVALECVTPATLLFLLYPFSLSHSLTSVSYCNAAVACDHRTPACVHPPMRLRPTAQVLLAGNPAYINIFSAPFICCILGAMKLLRCHMHLKNTSLLSTSAHRDRS